MKNQKLTEHLKKLILDEKMDDFFRILSDFFKSNNNLYQLEFKELEEQWRRNQQAKKLGMLPGNQSIASFSAVFGKFSKETIGKIPENNEVTEQLISSKDKYDFLEFEGSASKTKNNNSSFQQRDQKNSGIRPTIITVFCTLGALGVISNFINLISFSNSLNFSGFLIFGTIIQILLQCIHLIGLWEMKKWSILIYVFNFIFGLSIEVLSDISYSVYFSSTLLTLLFVVRILYTLIYWVVLGSNYNRMT